MMDTAITCDDVTRFIFSIAPDPKPFHDTENAYAFGDPRSVCTGVAVAWWPGPEILRRVVEERLNLVITHEDPIMELQRLPLLPHRARTPETFTVKANRERLRIIVENNLVVHRHHWNVDLAPWGIIGSFLDKMGWANLVVYGEGFARVVEVEPTPLWRLADHVKTRLGVPFVRVASPDSESHVSRRIGIAPGGYGQGWVAAALYHTLDCDTLIVGDMIHACAKMALECGMAVVDCFHHAAEEPGMRALAQRIAERFPSLPVRFFEEPTPWVLR